MGLWAIGTAADGNGLTVAVNSSAINYSIWPAGRETRTNGFNDEPVDIRVDGYEDAIDCVEAAAAAE